MKQSNKNFWGAIAILIGTIIGAGIFGLPYAVAQIGFWGGIFYLVLVTFLVLIVNRAYAEVILRTKDQMQMAGYARRYLGRSGKVLIALSLILGIFSAMVAYLIGVGNFLFSLLSPFLGGSVIVYSVLFWAVISLAIFLGLKALSRIELVLGGFLALLIIIIFVSAWPKINLVNLNYFSSANIFLPYTIFLFAMGGMSSIPLLVENLKENKQQIKKAITIGTIFPAVVYLIFIIGVVGVSGPETTEQAMDGLIKYLGNNIFIIGAILGIISMSTAFLGLGYVLKDVFIRDYKINRFFAWLITCLVPLIIFLLGMRSFIQVISIGGGLIGGFDGILVLIMFYRAKKRGDQEPPFKLTLPKVFGGLVALLFFLAIIYNIFNLIT